MMDWGASEANRLWLCEVALPGKPKTFGELHVPYIYQAWHVRPVHHLIWREYISRFDWVKNLWQSHVPLWAHCQRGEHGHASKEAESMLPALGFCSQPQRLKTQRPVAALQLVFLFLVRRCFYQNLSKLYMQVLNPTHWIQDANLDTFTFPQTSVSVRAVDELSGQAKKH